VTWSLVRPGRWDMAALHIMTPTTRYTRPAFRGPKDARPGARGGEVAPEPTFEKPAPAVRDYTSQIASSMLSQ
jgi:hypothetical protein